MVNNQFLPLVSIVIPVFNGEKYLKYSIQSALDQTYKNFEIIVVDDGSTDKTEQIAKSYGDKIRYIKKENGGVATALNLGISHMRGEYFAWLSHDDIYYKDKLLVQVNTLAKLQNKKTIIYSDYQIRYKNLNRLLYNVNLSSRHELSKLDNMLYAVLEGLINGCTLLIHKDIFSECGLFNKSLPNTQDYDLWYKIAKKNWPIKYISYKTIIFRLHFLQTSQRHPNVNKELDSLWLNMLINLNDDEINGLYGNKYNLFYKIQKRFSNNKSNLNKFLEQELLKLNEYKYRDVQNLNQKVFLEEKYSLLNFNFCNLIIPVISLQKGKHYLFKYILLPPSIVNMLKTMRNFVKKKI